MALLVNPCNMGLQLCPLFDVILEDFLLAGTAGVVGTSGATGTACIAGTVWRPPPLVVGQGPFQVQQVQHVHQAQKVQLGDFLWHHLGDFLLTDTVGAVGTACTVGVVGASGTADAAWRLSSLVVVQSPTQVQ